MSPNTAGYLALLWCPFVISCLCGVCYSGGTSPDVISNVDQSNPYAISQMHIDISKEKMTHYASIHKTANQPRKPPRPRKVFITSMKKWNLSYPAATKYKTTQYMGDTKLLVLPFGFFMIFLVGIAIKATHWWNEDIRHADGLLVNVYTPHRAPTRVLARIYSTEPSTPSPEVQGVMHREDSLRSERSVRLMHLSETSSIGSVFISKTEIEEGGYDRFAGNKSELSSFRSGGNRAKTGSIRSFAAASGGSPTESLCSRCKVDLSDTLNRNFSSRDLRQQLNDSDSLEMYSMNTLPKRHHAKQLRRQMSSVSSQSSGTVRSDTSSESAPLLISGRSQDRLNRFNIHGQNLQARRLHRDPVSLAVSSSSKKPLHPRLPRKSPLARRANSEIELKEHRNITQSASEPATAMPNLAHLQALLQNSLNLNLTLLSSMSESGVSVESLESNDNFPGSRESQHLSSARNEAFSPERISRQSSSVSSSDMASSLSAATSITALVSSLSSMSSLFANQPQHISSRMTPKFTIGDSSPKTVKRDKPGKMGPPSDNSHFTKSVDGQSVYTSDVPQVAVQSSVLRQSNSLNSVNVKCVPPERRAMLRSLSDNKVGYD